MTKLSSQLAFTKMEGTGNDFIIIDNRSNRLSKKEIIAIAPQFCDRRFGVGADGIIALQQADDPALDYTMFYRNADGSEAGMCGNGARCLALFAARLGLGEQLTFNVHDNIYRAEVNTAKRIVSIFFPMQVTVKKISLEDGQPLLQVPAGTEHIVKQVSKDKLDDEKFLTGQGAKLRNHPQFNPPGTNVNFLCGNSGDAIRLRTYERGVEDLTLACGTGAIASALAWHHLHEPAKDDEQVATVKTKGGNLNVYYTFDASQNCYKNIQLTGEARFVFEGTYPC